jgi:hypothetical protein
VSDGPHIGLPTVPVFTGGTGAVNGMPSRPVEGSPGGFYGMGTGRQFCRPSRQWDAVDGRQRLGFVTHSWECKNATGIDTIAPEEFPLRTVDIS